MSSSRYSRTTLLLLLICTVYLFGCMGSISGTVRGRGDKVQVFHTGSNSYSVTLTDGEIFTGAKVQVQTSHFSGSLIEAPTVRSPFGDVTYYYHFGPYRRALTYGGILFGSRGRTMWCNLYTTGFGGGQGLCDISDGSIIDFQW